jgi:division protein CdvB (Snf7/Vps24/ESCRT-III family)
MLAFNFIGRTFFYAALPSWQYETLEVTSLGKNFMDRWKEKDVEPSMASKIKNFAKPTDNLKDQITMVTQRLDLQTKTLNGAVQRFQARDADIFQRIVKAIANHDSAHASILATELTEIRKVEKLLMQTSLALESVSMRLSTVREMGDVVTVLGPAASVLQTVRTGMCSIFPEASQELESIGSLLGEIVTNTRQSADNTECNQTRLNEDALAILEEAEVAAEKKLMSQLPEVGASKPHRQMASVDV